MNIKLNPEKFHIGTRVEFGGSVIEYVPEEDRIEISPSEEKVEELIGKEAPTTKKQLQSILGSLNQLAQCIPKVKCHIPGMRKMTGINNKFIWNDELEEEFSIMKQFLKKHVKLCPYDVKKETHIHCDASNIGIGYLLSQPTDKNHNPNDDHYRLKRNIIQLGSAGLTPTQTRYSTIEQEMLSVLWAITKCDFYVRYASEIKIFCDNKNISDIFKMPFSDIRNQRLLRMREKMLG